MVVPKLTVLVVDDDELVRRALERSLRSSGYAIAVAEGGTAALQILQHLQVAAVISDHQMPDMTGLELMREVKRLQPGCFRLIITGFTPDLIAQAVAAGDIDRFLTKPWDNVELLRVLQAGIEGRVGKHPLGKTDPPV